MSDRDEQLGFELRRLDVPDHGPDFFPQLAARLEEEAARHPGSRRRPAWRRLPPRLWAATAALAVAAVVAVVILPRSGDSPLVPPSPTLGTRLISASEVRTRVATTLSSLRSLSGEVELVCAVPFGDCQPPDAGGRTTQRWSFLATAAGDERVTGIGRRDEVAYRADRGEQRAVSDSGSGGPPAQVITGLPAGPPDVAARPSVLNRNVAAAVRAFLASTADAPVGEVTEAGRPAWRLVVGVEPNKLAGPGASGDQLEVVVDRESGYPLRLTESLAGRFLHEVRLTNVVANPPIDAGAFDLALPAGVQPFRQDAGFRRVSLGEVAAVVGYTPVLPSAAGLPPGFHLAEVTVAAQAQPTGTEGLNPPSRRVVSVAYRRGFDRIVVTTRVVGTAARCSADPPGSGTTECWADPLATGEGFVDRPQAFVIAGGALAGSAAELVTSPRGVPHVWSINDRLVMTIGGDASAAELRRMAESFAPAG